MFVIILLGVICGKYLADKVSERTVKKFFFIIFIFN